MGDFPITFVDIDYEHPNFAKHFEEVKRHHPRYATVPDLSDSRVCHKDIDRAIRQAQQLVNYCEIPLIVPKLSGQTALLPRDQAIGYSVPSGYGGAQFPIWELAGRRVHLLGGSPKKQIQAYLHLSAIAEVMSIDSNYAQGQAVKYAMYWKNHRWHYHPKKDAGCRDLYLECWRWSCIHLRATWEHLTKH
jgi:hypothetical protein